MKSKGLGDSIEKALKATGIDKVAKSILGEDCGCEERKNRLNRIFPYARTFTKDEMATYKTVKPAIDKDFITRSQQQVIVKLYNDVFDSNKQLTNCGSCLRDTINKLKTVYENSCEI